MLGNYLSHKWNMIFHSKINLGVFRGQNGGQKGQNVPFSRRIDILSLKLAIIHWIGVRSYTLNKSCKKLGYWHNLRVYRGENGGRKGQNVPFSTKNEYFDLKTCNYTLNRSRKLNFKQILLKKLRYWHNLGVSRGQIRDQKGQNVPNSRKI